MEWEAVSKGEKRFFEEPLATVVRCCYRVREDRLDAFSGAVAGGKQESFDGPDRFLESRLGKDE